MAINLLLAWASHAECLNIVDTTHYSSRNAALVQNVRDRQAACAETVSRISNTRVTTAVIRSSTVAIQSSMSLRKFLNQCQSTKQWTGGESYCMSWAQAATLSNHTSARTGAGAVEGLTSSEAKLFAPPLERLFPRKDIHWKSRRAPSSP